MAGQARRLTGLKKRQQIELAGKAVFIWVAIAAVAVSLAVVALQFLYQQWTFNNSVLSAKYKASTTLHANVDAADKLKQNVNQLVGNSDLASIRAQGSDSNLQVVLDALPSRADVTALATSVQQVIAPHSGVSLESITVPTEAQDSSVTSTDTTVGPVEQKFTVVVTGSYDKIHGFTQDLEKTIRPMKVVGMTLSGSDNSLRASIDVITYYQVSKSVNITKKVIR
ncbi:MAG TPA: type 4a pilus biogenesis protein PilO [Candidatus Saccharimonadales bacterium]|jgi:Tfp pilus assembly protein PilO|nr:type 4a pilus biogenesis protein PilO [Candidatus Saccharimonadales bacterium]